MTWDPRNWSVRWQIVALIVATQLMAHIGTTLTIELATRQSGGTSTDLALTVSEPFLTALRMTSPAAPDEAGFAALTRADDRFFLLDHSPLKSAPADDAPSEVLRDRLTKAAPEGWRDRMMIYAATQNAVQSSFPVQEYALAARLDGGRWLVFEPRATPFLERVPQVMALLGISILALPIMFFAIWAGAAIMAPVAALAQGAERFAFDIEADDLPEVGPFEIRRATAAFNRMRARIRKLVAERSQALASIGHDMRTPLTRLRLRLELLTQNETTEAISRDLSGLQRMIDDALSYLRAESQTLRREPTDIGALTATLVDSHADLGAMISCFISSRVVVNCDRDLIRRALDNIIGNATKFAPDTWVLVSAEDEGAEIIVRDNGPGIPEAQRALVLEPFTRLDAIHRGIRTQSEGFGLGLTIARDLVQRHGGTLTLGDNDPHGLTVRIWLPGTEKPILQEDSHHV